MITQEEMDKYFEEAKREQDLADEARDEVRELIEQLDTEAIIYLSAFIKAKFYIDNFEPYGGALCASYRNGIREQISYCEDTALLDLIWKILIKTQPQDEDTAEHHKWKIEN